MDIEPTTSEQSDPGVLIGADTDRVEREYAWGQRASEIRRISLKYPELNKSQIAAMVGCSHQRVSQVLAEFLADTSPDYMDDFRADKANIYEAIQYRMLSSITQEKLDKTPAVSLITGVAILDDKIRLARGQPTAIHMNVLVDVLDILRTRDNDDSY